MTMQPSPSSPVKRAETPAWVTPGRSLLRTGLRVLGTVSPASAAKVMDRLWFSAPRTTPRAADQVVLDSGERLSFQVHGREVVAWAWGDKGPTVMLLHGWGGHAAQLQSFVRPLCEAGFRVVAFDAPSHGASAASRHGGQRVTFFEFADALRVIAAGESAIAGLVAHSGGCTAISLAQRAGWAPPAKLVFIAPFVHPSASIDGFARAIGANAHVVARFRAGVERWLGHPWSYLDITPSDAPHGQWPLLVIHDEDDKEVPLAHARTLADAWPLSQLMVTRGLGHRRVLRDPAVEGAVVSFLANGSPVTVAKPRGYLPRDSRAALDKAYEACVSSEAAIFARR